MSPPAVGAVSDAPPSAERRSLGEQVLVARARDGDARAFEQLVRQHQQAMYAVALRIVTDPDDAQDATQNAFVAAWRRLPQFRGQAQFSTWLFRIVTNRSLNQLRRRQRNRDSSLDINALPADRQPVAATADPYQHSETNAVLADLRAALSGLPDELRVCWLLREVDNCSYQEVADIIGTNVDTVRGRIYRARHRLAEAMASWR